VVRLAVAIALILSTVSAAYGSRLAGLVVSTDARPVTGAHVELLPDRTVSMTDDEGRFAFVDAGEPTSIVVRHPLYEVHRLRVSPDERVLTIRMRPKISVRQEVSVTADGPSSPRPHTLPASDVDPRAAVGPVTSVADLVASVPGVAQNGQAGLLQPVSIRGESGHRVLTFVGGMRVVTDRRAGTAASFVDPLLLGSVAVTRGPAATTRGAGALGGSLELWPRRFDGVEARTGYDSHGDGTHALAGWGQGGWSVAAVHRRASGGRAADGTPLSDGFSQVSSAVRGGWRAGGLAYDLLLVAASARDVGKASTDAPERTTVYPEDDHLMLKLGIETAGAFRFEAWVHPSELVTEVVDATSIRRVVNESVDFGAAAGRSWQRSGGVALRAGIDHFGRRGVEANETRVLKSDPAAASASRTLAGGREDETGLHGQVSWSRGRTSLDGGVRLIHHRQRRAGEDGVNDTAATAFGGVSFDVRDDLELSLHAGTGLRYPALGERFFSGTTGRGQVLGNEALERERSSGIDAGMRWKGRRALVTAHVFRQRVSELIQRVEIAPDLLTFENVVSGTVRGLELESAMQLSRGWSVEAGGHALEGRTVVSRPLADIPASRLHVGVRRRAGRWTWRARVEHRAAKGDPANGEKSIPDADLVTASLEYEHPAGVTVRIAGRNLLDDEFFASADQKAPLSAGRSIGAAVTWRR